MRPLSARLRARWAGFTLLFVTLTFLAPTRTRAWPAQWTSPFAPGTQCVQENNECHHDDCGFGDHCDGDEGRTHTGVDLRADPGTPVYAPINGRVVFARWATSYGGTVVIQSTDDSVYAVIGHLRCGGSRNSRRACSDLSVAPGTPVSAGATVLGVVGPTDSWQNGGWIPHTHVTVTYGVYPAIAATATYSPYAGYSTLQYGLCRWANPRDAFADSCALTSGTHYAQGEWDVAPTTTCAECSSTNLRGYSSVAECCRCFVNTSPDFALVEVCTTAGGAAADENHDGDVDEDLGVQACSGHLPGVWRPACQSSASLDHWRSECVGVCQVPDTGCEPVAARFGAWLTSGSGADWRPCDDGGGAAVHQWNAAWVQNLCRVGTGVPVCSSNLSYESALLDGLVGSIATAIQLRDEYWNAYRCLTGTIAAQTVHGGPLLLGVPISEEGAVDQTMHDGPNPPCGQATVGSPYQLFANGCIWLSGAPADRTVHIHLAANRTLDEASTMACAGNPLIFRNPADDPTCQHACEPGEARCPGGRQYLVCGDLDGDGCRDWLPLSCATGEVCDSDACVACGGFGQPCCSDTSCQPELICRGGACSPAPGLCGGYGETCCSGSTCSGSFVCSSGMCLDSMMDAGPDAGASACAPDQTFCSGRCVDLGSDPFNCGGCGRSCRSDMVCLRAGCTAPCLVGETYCNGQCVDLTSNMEHCGACDAACLDRPNAFSTCVVGLCGYSCASGFGDCDRASANGCEQDLNSDAANCGLCGHACSPGISCRRGTCEEDIAELAAGSVHTCARRGSGSVLCFGADSDGQLGDGSMTTARPTAVATVGLTDAVQLAAGEWHSCAVRIDASVVCWGRNDSGQLGDGTMTVRAAPVPVVGLTGVVAIAAGGQHTCALMQDGTVRCWGSNGSGQLGTGAVGMSLTPTNVSGVAGAIAVAAGSAYTCALSGGGSLQCWGRNDMGQLGDGTLMQRSRPVPVIGIVDAVEIRGHYNHTCARLAGGQVLCWGDNQNGDLGLGAGPPSGMPTAVPTVESEVAMALGSTFTCVGDSDGPVRCWGQDNEGELGDGLFETMSLTPAVVVGLSHPLQLVAGDLHACAMATPRSVMCWGRGIEGQLGYGGTLASDVPVTVIGIP